MKNTIKITTTQFGIFFFLLFILNFIYQRKYQSNTIVIFFLTMTLNSLIHHIDSCEPRALTQYNHNLQAQKNREYLNGFFLNVVEIFFSSSLKCIITFKN